MEAKEFIQEFQDHLAPRLDTYEQAIYLYLFRHSRLQGKAEIIVGLKSARAQMAFGVGENGKPMSEHSCYKRVRSLEAKGCLDILGSERTGTKVRLRLPSEIEGLIPLEQVEATLNLEEMDFFDVPENRSAIVRREKNKCFYCLRSITLSNYVIEHVISRPEGNNSYRNLVASCLSCNNKKGSMLAEDFLRILYRNGFLSDADFEQRLVALQLLKQGELKPEILAGNEAKP